MARTIYKYNLPLTGQIVQIPAHVKPLYVAMQGHNPMLWAEIDTDNKSDDRMKVYCVGTGWPIPGSLTYIGTVQDGAGFVWHFYSLPPGAVEPW